MYRDQEVEVVSARSYSANARDAESNWVWAQGPGPG